MDSNQLRQEYSAQIGRANRLREALCEQIEKVLASSGIALGVPLESRVKALASLEEKLNRKALNLANLIDLNDLVGIRIILLFKRDVPTVANLLSKTFDVISSEDTAERLKEAQFGYQSLHYVIRVPTDWTKVPTLADLGSLKAEIQLRTLAQHIWAAASHKLQYKQEESVPPPIRRSIHRVSALLETVDLEFERVLDDRRAYLDQAAKESTVDAPLDVDLLSAILMELLPAKNKGRDEDYSNLLSELKHFGVNTSRKLRELLNEQMSAILKEEKSELEARRTSKDYRGTTKKRIDAGVFFYHVGLVREALSQKFGGSYREYQALHD